MKRSLSSALTAMLLCSLQFAEAAPVNMYLNDSGEMRTTTENSSASSTLTGCSSDGQIKITGITPPRETILQGKKQYTFDVQVSYAFTNAMSGSVGINVHDAVYFRNLDGQTQRGSSALKSGNTNVSVTATTSVDGNAIQNAVVSVALFASGSNCTGVADQVNYSVSAAATYLNIVGIPDATGDGVMEQALLIEKSGKYYIRTIDGVTGKQLNQSLLGAKADILPSSLTAVDQSISILMAKSTGVNILQIRDNATLGVVRTLTLPK